MTHRFRLLLRARTLKLDQAFTTSRHYRKKWNHPTDDVYRDVTPNLLDRARDETHNRWFLDETHRETFAERSSIEETQPGIRKLLSFLSDKRPCRIYFQLRNTYSVVLSDPSLLCKFKNTLCCKEKSYKICPISTLFYNIYFIFFLFVNFLFFLHFIHTRFSRLIDLCNLSLTLNLLVKYYFRLMTEWLAMRLWQNIFRTITYDIFFSQDRL